MSQKAQRILEARKLNYWQHPDFVTKNPRERVDYGGHYYNKKEIKSELGKKLYYFLSINTHNEYSTGQLLARFDTDTNRILNELSALFVKGLILRHKTKYNKNLWRGIP